MAKQESHSHYHTCMLPLECCASWEVFSACPRSLPPFPATLACWAAAFRCRLRTRTWRRAPPPCWSGRWEAAVCSLRLQAHLAFASAVCLHLNHVTMMECARSDLPVLVPPATLAASCPSLVHTATPIHHDPRAGSPAAPIAQAALEAAAEGLKLENSALIQQFDRLKLRFEAESAAFQEQVGGRVGLGGSTRIGGLLDGGAWVQTMHCQCCRPASRGAKRAIKVQPLPAGLAWLNLLPQPFHPCTAV